MAIDFTNGNLSESAQESLDNIIELGVIPARVKEYLGKHEFDPTIAVGDPQELDAVQKRMWRYLQRRGVSLSDDAIWGKEGYDEILYAAFDSAIRSRDGGKDPIDGVRQREGVDGEDLWDFVVQPFETFEEKGILPESIRAAGAIDYVYEFGERLGAFPLGEHLVVAWARGDLDVGPTAAGKLYRYWKLLDERSDESERGLLYGRVLGKGDAQPLSRMTFNTPFPRLWSTLMSEIADYIDKSERNDAGRSEDSPVSPNPIYQAIREIQHNLSEYCTGLALHQVRELYAQLQEVFELFRDPEVVAHYGSPRRRNVFTVIERLSKEVRGTAVPIGPLQRVAIDGNKVFMLCADFDEANFSHEQLMQLVDAGESYIINSAIIEDTSMRGEEEFDEEFDDEFEEVDELEKEFEDF